MRLLKRNWQELSKETIPNPFSIKDKIIIISGAGRGIGRYLAHSMAKHSAFVYCIDKKFPKEVPKDVKKNMFNVRCDITNNRSFMKVCQNIFKTSKKIDVLVNNAGVTKDNIIMRMKEKDWDNVMNINLKGCFNGIKSVTRPMIKNKRGRIINITSVIGQIGNAGQSNYAASKAGIMGLTKSMAKELGSRNITVNAIAPGYITTDMTGELNNDIKEQIQSSIPLGRLGTPDDVASLVCYLVSEEAGYITGQTFNVDGGMVMI